MRRQLAINLRYCYLARRTTQNMSASHSLPTITEKNEREGLKWMTMNVPFLWRWELVIFGTMCGTKRLNPFFRLHEAS